VLPVAPATSKVTGNLERKAAQGAATAEPRRVFSGKTRGSCANTLLRAVVLWKTLTGKRELINFSSF